MADWKRVSFLRTRFGRRMLLLFLVCAMFPLVGLTGIILREVSGEMTRQEHANLRRSAKAIGMATVAKFTATSDFSGILATAAAASRDGLRAELASDGAARLAAVAVLRESGDTLAAWHPDAFARLAQQLPARADTKLLFATQTGGTQMLAITSTHDVAGHALRVVALIEPAAFFGQTEILAWLDSGMQSCLMLEGTALWCSTARESWGRVQVSGDRGAMVAGRTLSAARWSGFAPITVGKQLEVVTFNEAPIALGASPLFRSLIILALISIVLVFLLSHVQLRRSLRPLEQLTDATRRVGTDNLGVRVDVELNDEFGTLARSFNDMSSRLTSQVALLSSTAAVNDEALRALSIPELLPRLTNHVRALLPSDFGMSLGVRIENQRWLRLSAMTRSTEWVQDEVEFGEGGLRTLLESELVSGRFGSRPSHPYLHAPMERAGWDCPAVALPLRAERDLVGVLTVLLPEGVLATNRVLHNIRAIASDLVLAINRTRLLGRLEQFNYGTLTALARTVDANSPWTAGHSENVTHGALRLGEALNLTSDELDLLHRGGLLHDIGKIAVPGAILDKPGRLTPEERAVVESHPEVGARILAPIDAYAPIIPIVLYHHERFDGDGYPHKLRGQAIPFLARVVTVADVFDALVSDRPYREGWEPSRAVAFIQENAGTHFDPAIVEAFTTIEAQLRGWYGERRAQDLERRRVTRTAEMTAA